MGKSVEWDEVVHLGNGHEISLEAAFGDLKRMEEALNEALASIQDIQWLIWELAEYKAGRKEGA